MDGDHRSKVLAFAEWQRHEAWPPLDTKAYKLYTRGNEDAQRSERMHRRIIWACVVFLCAWAYAMLGVL